MRIVIIGSAGHYHQLLEAQAQRPGLDVVGIAPGRPDEDVGGLAARFPTLVPHADWRRMLDDTAPEVAVVNSWYCENADISMECLRRGLDVFSEKPMATDMNRLAALKEVWQQSGRALGGMFNLRYCAWFATVKRLVDAGEVGEVRLLHGQKSYKLGTRPPFYHRRELMGGMLPWVGVHAVDWVRELGGRCLSVCACQSSAHNGGQGDLETSAALLMQMENGVIGTVTADYFRPAGSARHDDDRLRVTGTRGMIEAFDGRVFLENDQPKREIPLEPGKKAFLAFLDARGTPESAAQTLAALESSRIALAGRQSGDEGRLLTLGEW